MEPRRWKATTKHGRWTLKKLLPNHAIFQVGQKGFTLAFE
jgi:hypothetical protein